MKSSADLELVIDQDGLLLRRVVVGTLSTNCWIISTTTSNEAIVIDPGDEAERLIDAAGDLHVSAIVLTHSHWDHVLALPTVADAWGCDVFMHPDDGPVWPHEIDHLHRFGHFDAGTATADLITCGCSLTPSAGALWSGSTRALRHGQTLAIGLQRAHVIHTPGHTPGSVSVRVGGHVFTGDTLFPGGPGLTGWPFSDFTTIIGSISERLFSLPGNTVVHPGHGLSTTIAAEEPELDQWVARGW